jgi:hypothetical protein
VSPPKKQVIGYDEAAWELLGGQGRRMPDFVSDDFVATMDLNRVWSVTVRFPEDRSAHSAASWWDDHCDDDRRVLVRGVLPFRAIAGKRHHATRLLMRCQAQYDVWVQQGCPAEGAA